MTPRPHAAATHEPERWATLADWPPGLAWAVGWFGAWLTTTTLWAVQA